MDSGKSTDTAKPSPSNDHPNENRAVTRSRSSSLPKGSANQKGYDNLMRGKASASRSRKSQDSNEDFPEPVVERTDTVKTTHEELHKIQQVCQQENETIRKQVKSITDKVSCLKIGQEPTNGQEKTLILVQ